MPRATIIIGFPQAGSREQPSLVHFGVGGDAATAAMAASRAAHFEVYRQVQGIARPNPQPTAEPGRPRPSSEAAQTAEPTTAEPAAAPAPAAPAPAPKPGFGAKLRSLLPAAH